MMRDASPLGFTIPQILIPVEGVNMSKWSCVACDQFTSQPEYWEAVERFVGSADSSLHIILPELYLHDNDVEDRILHCKSVMEDYLQSGVMELLPPGIMLTERHIGNRVRKGILLAMDLEQYDYRIENKPLIRATEQTVLSRIPPRVKIRDGAPFEMPHVMLLMDDERDAVIGPLHAQRDGLKKIYDFDLMMGSGRIEGWLADDPALINSAIDAISRLHRHDNMLFCVGDGNHSLATAKTIWEEEKQHIPPHQRANHPLRYALCEIINLRDIAVEFMPIHRVIFGVNPTACAQFIVETLRERGVDAKLIFGRWRSETTDEDGKMQIPILYKDGAGRIVLENPEHVLAVGEVQDIFEKFVAKTPGAHIDYIHGDEAFMELATGYDCIGFYFPSLRKSTFFDLIIKCGVLPKKTFSLGEAEQKRYYLECRMLECMADETAPAEEITTQAEPTKREILPDEDGLEDTEPVAEKPAEEV